MQLEKPTYTNVSNVLHVPMP